MKKSFSQEEREQLKRWQKKPVETKLDWLASAIEFQRAIKQSKKK